MTVTAQPLKKDYYRTAIELSLFLAIEYDLFDIYSIQKKAHKNQIGLITPYEINLFGAKII